MFDDKLLTVDFSEYNKIVTREIIATKNEEDDYPDDSMEIDMGDQYNEMDTYTPNDSSEESEIETPEEEDKEEDEKVDEKVDESPIIQETEDLPDEEIEESEDVLTEQKKPEDGISIFEIYNKRNKKKNVIVESLLIDNTVDTIERIIKSSLSSCGISKAESTIVLGLILDKMLHASDDEVIAPDFLDTTLGDLITNKDVAKIVKKSVVDALSGIDNPGLETLWSESNLEEPKKEEVKGPVNKAVKDEYKEEE